MIKDSGVAGAVCNGLGVALLRLGVGAAAGCRRRTLPGRQCPELGGRSAVIMVIVVAVDSVVATQR